MIKRKKSNSKVDEVISEEVEKEPEEEVKKDEEVVEEKVEEVKPEEKVKEEVKPDTPIDAESMFKSLGVNSVNIYPGKFEFEETRTGIDLRKDGKLPFAIMLEDDSESVCELEVEISDGRCFQQKIHIKSCLRDWFGNEFYLFKVKSRFFSPLMPMLVKKIVKCSSKKVYILY